MTVLVLAGGLGTRMQAVAGSVPKALLPVGEHTFLFYQLQWLKLIGFENVVMALGHKSEQIELYVSERCSGEKFPKTVFVDEGRDLLGTGGAVKNALHLLPEDFAVTYGDTLLRLKARELWDLHKKQKPALTMAIFRNQNVADVSNITLKGDRLYYNKFERTPDMDYIDYGMMMINKAHFEKETPSGRFDLAVYLEKTSRDGQARAYIAPKIFLEIGSPEGYRRFQEEFKNIDYDLSAWL